METIKQFIQKIAFLFLSKEKKEVIRTLQAYADAFMTFEPKNVLGYFHKPMMFLEDTGCEIFESDEDIEEFLDKYMKELQENNYSKDVLSGFHLKTLTDRVAVTSFNLKRVDKAGKVFFNGGAMYTWEKDDGAWRVVIGVLLKH